MKLVKVEWWDTVQSSGWDTAEEVNIMKVDQIGWFLNESTWSEDGVVETGRHYSRRRVLRYHCHT